MDIREIASLVEQETGISWPEMRLNARRGEIVFARQLVMTFARKYTVLSRRQIGKPFGRDGATVFHAEKTISDLCETDKRINSIFRRINTKVWHGLQYQDFEDMCNNCVQL